jgi:hypothetical protein
VPAPGIAPHLHDPGIPEEDAVVLEGTAAGRSGEAGCQAASFGAWYVSFGKGGQR